MRKSLGCITALVFIVAFTPALHAQAPTDHPEIRKAIEALKQTKQDLEHVSHDYAGHRVLAVRHVDDALRELDECLKAEEK